jgi:hypothetical protein
MMRRGRSRSAIGDLTLNIPERYACKVIGQHLTAAICSYVVAYFRAIMPTALRGDPDKTAQ